MIFAQFAAFGRSAAGGRRIGHFQPVGPIYAGDGALPVKNGSNATERIIVHDSRRRKTRKTPTRRARDKDADAAGNAGIRDKKKRPHEAGVKLLRQVSYRQETYRAVPLL